jgi:SAM-dependent methyltransferase
MEPAMFPTPSSFFAWCIETTANIPDIPFHANYPQYCRAQTSTYLWETYDRRLADITALRLSGLRVLEVGCGIGADLHWLALQGARAVGIDVKSEWVAAAKALSEHVTRELAPVAVDIRRTNLLDMPESETFDLIYMKDTFHHLEPRAEIVRKLASLLSPDGAIVIIEPNAWNVLIQLKMFRIRGFRTVVEKIDTATGERFQYGNERLVSGAALRRLFRDVGIVGSTRLLRLVPTALSENRIAVALGRKLESMETLLAPALVHCVYMGRRSRMRGAQEI